MPPKGQATPSQGSNIHLTPEGDRAGRWSFPRLLWTARTLLQKWVIRLQDRLGLYTYSHWIRTVERGAVRRALQAPVVSGSPSVCFIILPSGSDEQGLSRTCESIRQQSGCASQVVLLDPTNRWTDWATVHPGVQALAMEGEAWQTAANHLPGEWLVPLSAGDQLAPDWAGLFQRNQLPDVDIVYWDEDRRLPGGGREQPFFKPDWSPELLFSMNYLHTAAFRKSLLFDLAMSGEAADAGWIFNAGRKARQILHLPFILTHRSSGSGYSLSAHAKVAQAYLARSGYRQAQAWVTENQTLRVSWEGDEPLVSVVIPTRNNLLFLRRCLETLLEKTDYPDYEILLMDDHSTDPAVLAYYGQLERAHANVHIYHNAEAFNYSRVNNQGVANANGELLLFLNNDMEILDPGWLKEMVRWVLLPGVGMVGAKLLYPDGGIQHAGIVLGMTGHAGHVYAGNSALPPGLFVSPDAYRNVSAVTGACMLVRREVFERIGGFEEKLGLVFNDVDLAVRVMRGGSRIIYTPAAQLIHYEGRSRARFIPREDIRLGAQRLADEIAARDRYYNPNLSLAVNWPTLVRRGEVAASARLEQIRKFKG